MHIGIDLGGTKTEILALAPDGETRLRRRVATARGYEACLDQLAELVAGAERELGARGTVGVGMPGSLSPTTGRVRNANSVWLNGAPFAADLGGRLARSVRIENDANCFALSEAVDGAGRGAASVFGVIIGTGVGGGLVLDGQLVTGAQAIAGEWGHNPLPGRLPDDGPACYCGRSGCIETYLSGPGLARDHVQAGGTPATAEEIAARAAAGEQPSVASLERYVRRLGRALAVVVNIVDPEVVVLGGGLSNIADLPERTTKALLPHVFSDEPRVCVRRHVHGDASGVRGAAWLGAGRIPGPQP